MTTSLLARNRREPLLIVPEDERIVGTLLHDLPVEIEVLACSTYFEAGTSLRGAVLGHDAARYPAFKQGRSVNRGTHSIHTGGRYPSALLTPFVNR